MTETELTEDQQEAIVRVTRARKALEAAPEAAYRLRWDAIPLDGRTEPGFAIPHESTPMLTAITDRVDAFYVWLAEWAGRLAEQLDVVPPQLWMWRNASGEPLGFKGEADPETVHSLVTSVCAWMLWHETEIAALGEEGELFHLDIAEAVWSLRGAVGMTRSKKPAAPIWFISDRPCPNPACGLMEVRAEFFGEPIRAAEARGEFDVNWTATADERRDPNSPAGRKLLAAIEGVKVRCLHCGWSAAPRASAIAEWLA